MTGKWNCLLEVSTRYGGIIIVILLFNWGINSIQKCVVFI